MEEEHGRINNGQGNLFFMSGDNLKQILTEKDQMIEDLQRRIRTMSSVDSSIKSNNQLIVEHHQKSKSLPNNPKNNLKKKFSFRSLFQRRQKQSNLQIEEEENNGNFNNEKSFLYEKRKMSNSLYYLTEQYEEDVTEKEERLFTLKELLSIDNVNYGEIEQLLNSAECLEHFGCFRSDLREMHAEEINELKRRSFLLPHQIPSLRQIIMFNK